MVLELTDEQTKALCVLIQLGVKAIGAQIERGGVDALDSGMDLLSRFREITTIVNTALATPPPPLAPPDVA